MSHGKAHRGARAGPSMAATDTGANRTGGLGLSQSHKLLNYALLALVEPRFPVQIPERAARAAHHPPRTASWSHTINYTGGSAAEARPQHPGSMRSRAACAPASPETCRCTPLPARCRLSLSLSLSLFPGLWRHLSHAPARVWVARLAITWHGDIYCCRKPRYAHAGIILRTLARTRAHVCCGRVPCFGLVVGLKEESNPGRQKAMMLRV